MQLAKFHFDNIYWQKKCDLGHIVLDQIGDLCCSAGYEVDEHVQWCYEISYIVSGSGTFIVDGERFEVSRNQVVLNRPGQRHQIISSTADPLRYVYVGFYFSESHPDYKFYHDIRKLFDSLLHFSTLDTNNIYRFFCDSFSEIISGDTMMLEMLKTYVSQIIVNAYRDFCHDTRNSYRQARHTRSEEQIVYSILNYIESNSYNVNELSNMAAALGYSYPYLSQLFSNKMGCSIQSYSRKKLFEQIVDMIKDNRSFSDIAATVGYSSLGSFSRAFTNYFGVSPKQYRDRLAKGESVPESPEEK